MKRKDMQIGQRVRCTFSGYIGKIGVIKDLEGGQIVVEWEDGSLNSTRWSYADSFELAEPKPTKNNVCFLCGYPDAYEADAPSKSTCSCCAEKVYFADRMTNPEELETKRKRWKEVKGDGFDPIGWAKQISFAEQEFKKLQNRENYKVGDRLQVRIENEEPVWATIIETWESDHNVLFYLDKPFEGEKTKSWKTDDKTRSDIIKERGLDSNASNCLWWQSVSTSRGSDKIVVLNQEPKVNMSLQDRTQYKSGDRIKIRLKDKELWATVIDQTGDKTAIYLDEEYARSWASVDYDRRDKIQSLGLNRTAPKCLWWGNTVSSNTIYGDKDLTVLEYQPKAEVKPAADPKLQDPKQYKLGDRIQVRLNNEKDIWATVIDHESHEGTVLFLDEEFGWVGKDLKGSSWATTEIPRSNKIGSLGMDYRARQCIFWGKQSVSGLKNEDVVVLQKGTPKPVIDPKLQDPKQYKEGDRIKVKIRNEKEVWAVIVEHDPYQGTILFLEEPYSWNDGGSFATNSQKRIDILKKLGLNPAASRCFKWAPSSTYDAKHDGCKKEELVVLEKGKPIIDPKLQDPTQYKEEGQIKIKSRSLQVGDVVRYTDALSITGSNPPLTQGRAYRVRKVDGSGADVRIFLEGFNDDAWWWEHRFEYAEPGRFQPGDTLKATRTVCDLKENQTYKVKTIQNKKRAANPGDDEIVPEGAAPGEFYWAHRFELDVFTGEPTPPTAPVKYGVGDRVEISVGTHTSWATIVGNRGGDIVQKDYPVAYVDKPTPVFGGTGWTFPNQKELYENAKKLGLDPNASKFWVMDPTNGTKVISHKPKEEKTSFPPEDMVRIKAEEPPIMSINAGNNAPPLTFTFDKGQWEPASTAPVNIASPKTENKWEGGFNADWAKLKADLMESWIIPSTRYTVGFDPPTPNVDGGKLEFTKGINEKEFSQPKEDVKTFGEMIKEDASSAGYRVAAHQLTKGIKAVLLQLMKDRGTEDGKLAVIRDLLDTEVGSALIAMILGMSMTYIPKFNQDPRAQKLAGEFRVGSMAIVGNSLMEVIWGYVKSLPAPEKVRINTKEVRVSEETEEEENEASSSHVDRA